MKNTIFTSLITLIILLFAYLLIGIWGIFEIKKNSKLLFSNKENYLFHKKYSEKIHHLRDVDRWGVKKNEYLFSEINNNGIKTILFQGDSWIESISEIKTSKNLIEKFAKKNNFNVFNAGITSYAPSLMHKQYEILKEDFNILPNIILIYIDQTDIGDEFCRYKNNKVYSKQGNLIKISREKFSRATYDYSKIYIYSELNFENNFQKILKFPIKKSEYFLKRNINSVKNILTNGYQDRNQNKCSFKQIMKELFYFNLEAKNNFKKSLTEYLKYLKQEKKIEQIFIASFPHKNHLTKKYRVNVSDYIDEVLSTHKDDRIKHINMSKMNFKKNQIDKIYIKNDLASHLKSEFHTNIFLKNILSYLEN